MVTVAVITTSPAIYSHLNSPSPYPMSSPEKISGMRIIRPMNTSKAKLTTTPCAMNSCLENLIPSAEEAHAQDQQKIGEDATNDALLEYLEVVFEGGMDHHHKPHGVTKGGVKKAPDDLVDVHGKLLRPESTPGGPWPGTGYQRRSRRTNKEQPVKKDDNTEL